MSLNDLAALFNFSSMGVVVLLTILARRRTPSPFFAPWLHGHLFGMVAIAFDSLVAPTSHQAELLLLSALYLAAAWSYIQTGNLLRERPTPLFAFFGLGAALLATSIAFALRAPLLVIAAPSALFLSLSLCYVGVLFLRPLPTLDGGSFAVWLGWPLFLIGLTPLAYPLFHPRYDWIGFSIAGMLHIFSGLGMIMFVLETKTQELEREIRERQRVEGRLQERERLLSQITDHVRDLVALADADGRFQYVSPSFQRILGYAPEDLLGRWIFEIVHPDDLVIVADAYTKGYRHNTSGFASFRYLHKDGHYLWVESAGNLVSDEKGEIVGAVFANRDITDRKQAEEALRQSEERYRNLFEQAMDGIFLADRAGRFLDANASACRMAGYSLEELKERTVFDLHRPVEHAHLLADMDKRWQGEALSGEWSMVRKDGSLLPVEMSINVTSSGLGQAFLRDISDRKKAEQEKECLLREQVETLRETDRMKDEFLSVISHELRTPLNAIIGFASLLSDGVMGGLSDPQRNCIEKVLSGSDQMLRLVDDLLDYARIQAKKLTILPEWTDYPVLVQEAISLLEPLATEKGICISTEVPEGLVSLDERRIRQVLTNLLSNAIKFTPPGGQIRVTAFREGDALVTEVRDTGIGIASEDLSKLFTPFKQLDMGLTRKAGGTGLGLSVCRGIVQGHGGIIVVESPGLGQGATFRFTLPQEKGKLSLPPESLPS
ncbi:MAG: PAS domain S-box protein [Bacteroidota bacterium]